MTSHDRSVITQARARDEARLRRVRVRGGGEAARPHQRARERAREERRRAPGRRRHRRVRHRARRARGRRAAVRGARRPRPRCAQLGRRQGARRAARRARRIGARERLRGHAAAARDHRAGAARRRGGARDLAGRHAAARRRRRAPHRAARRQGQGARDGDAQRQAGARALQDPAYRPTTCRAATRSTTSRMRWGSTRRRCAWSATTSPTSAAPTSSPRWSSSRTRLPLKSAYRKFGDPRVRRRHRGDLPGAEPPARAGSRTTSAVVEPVEDRRRGLPLAPQAQALRLPAGPDHRRRRAAAGRGRPARARRRRRQRHPDLRPREAARGDLAAGRRLPGHPAAQQRGAVPAAAHPGRGAPVRDHLPAAEAQAPTSRRCSPRSRASARRG